MQKYLPHPALSVFLGVVWLLLNNTVAPGHVLLALVLGVLVPIATRPFWTEAPRVSHWPKLGSYILLVLWDIVTANVVVARLVFVPNRDLRPAFVEMPLRLTDPFAIAMLTSTISLTPGTVSASVTEDRKWLLIHCLSLDDEAQVLSLIQSRYEDPLLEIYGC